MTLHLLVIFIIGQMDVLLQVGFLLDSALLCDAICKVEWIPASAPHQASPPHDFGGLLLLALTFTRFLRIPLHHFFSFFSGCMQSSECVSKDRMDDAITAKQNHKHSRL